MEDEQSEKEAQYRTSFESGDQITFLPLRSVIHEHSRTISSAFRSFSARSISNPDLNVNFCNTFEELLKCFTECKHASKPTPSNIIKKERNKSKTTTIVSKTSQQTQTDSDDTLKVANNHQMAEVEGNYCEIPLQTMPQKPNRKLSKRSAKLSEIEQTSLSSKCDISGEYSEATTATTNTQPEEIIYAPSTFEDDDDDIEDEYDEFDDCDESSSGGYFERDSLPRPPLPTNSRFDALFRGKDIKDLPKNAASVKRRAKESFRQFMKINKIASNKLLSIRLRDAQGTLRKKIFSFAAFDALHRNQRHKSRRPTREPPPPPILIFRPAAPEPSPTSKFDHSPSSEAGTSASYKQSDCDNISELYHDSFIPENEDEEAIYSFVEEIQQSPEIYGKKNVEDQEDQYDETAVQNRSAYEVTGYCDDGECIYEELSMHGDDDETVYEDYFDDDDDDDEQTYGNVEDLKSAEQKEKEQTEKEIKRIKKMTKMMKKFHLNGDEVPINSGIVVSDRRGSRNNLFVRQGETVLIIRMDGNPPGKWLAKNERSKLGYVDPDNVAFDTESIAAVIKSFHNL